MKIKQDIEAVMLGKRKDCFLETVLYALSLIYGGIVKLRSALYQKEILRAENLPCKVISIGNIAAGGTGKTPMTVYLAEKLSSLGFKVVVVSRGYKGRAEKKGGIVSNGKEVLMEAGEAGDEPFMIAKSLKNVPVIVGKKRFQSGLLAINHFKPDIILLDDAFQHLKLKRDINIVLLDSRNPFGTSHVIPRGILREPLSALLRGDIFVFTRCDSGEISAHKKLNKIAEGRPVFKCFHRPYIYKIIKKKQNTERRSYRKAAAFSGIANHNDFKKSAESLGFKIISALEFPDHHPYSHDDIKEILREAENADADIIVTTEKDYARIGGKISWPLDLAVIGIEIIQEDDYAFIENITSLL